MRPCTIADMSGDGVRLVVDSPQTVSDRFTLLMTRDAARGTSCRVKWRRGSTLGAAFLKAG